MTHEEALQLALNIKKELGSPQFEGQTKNIGYAPPLSPKAILEGKPLPEPIDFKFEVVNGEWKYIPNPVNYR